MSSMLGKVFDALKKFNEPTSDVMLESPVPDFIPYACHFDKETILTKNGELVQTIKITGFSGEVIGAEKTGLRSVVREAIKNHIPDEHYALWIHTIRRKQSLDPGGHYSNEFSHSLNQAWKARHSWGSKYVNEVYISVIRSGASAQMVDVQGLLMALSSKSLNYHHSKKLNAMSKELNNVTDAMLETLGGFGARKLSIVQHEGISYSQPASFFGKILNLADVPMPVPVEDLSTYLASNRVAFGFNATEVRGRAGKRFGAIYTIKEYHEIPSSAWDQFLQLPMEFIVTQTLDFVNASVAQSQFKRQYDVLQASGAEKLAKISGLQEIMQGDTGSPLDFGQSQLTIMFIDDELEKLNKDLENAAQVFRNMGILVTRRDLRLEECFWAQLPANFSYISRSRPIDTNRVGGLASLYNFPAGKRKGNKWGVATTVFYTDAGTPYFFNFHDEHSGHTSIIGPFGAGKTVIMNFLVSEAQKYNGKLFFFDQGRASKVFINAIGGHYSVIKPDEASVDYAYNPLNILNIEDSKVNRDYLKRWMLLMVSSQQDEISDQERDILSKSIDYIATVTKDYRVLRHVVEFIQKQPDSERLLQSLSPWVGSGKYAHLFDNMRQDSVPLDGMIYGFGMSHIIEDKATLGPVLSYLFHRIEMALDGTPTVVVLDEAWNLVNNPTFAPGLADWLDRLAANNAIVIFATESVDNASKSQITNTIVERIATQIFLPNVQAYSSSVAYKKIWGLSPNEFEMLTSMTVQKRQFMLRQGGDAVVASLDLEGIKELSVLSGSDESVKMMEGAIETKGDDPGNWLQRFYEMA